MSNCRSKKLLVLPMQLSRRSPWRDKALTYRINLSVSGAFNLAGRFGGGKFTFVLLQLHQGVFVLNVVGCVSTLGAIPFFGFPVPSNVFVLHR